MTAEVEEAARQQAQQITEAQQAELDTAADSLLVEIARRADQPMVKAEAETFLCAIGLRRKHARELVDAGGYGRWLLSPLPDRRGNPVALVPHGAEQ